MEDFYDAEQDTTREEQDEESDRDGGYYYEYGCLVVTTGPKLPIAAAVTEQKED